jgi:hypothetical protein
MRDSSLIKKFQDSLENLGFALVSLSLSSSLRKRKNPRRKRKLNLKRKNNPRRKKNQKRKKTRKRRKSLRKRMMSLLSQLRRRKILSNFCPNHLSTLMTGKDSSVTLPTKKLLLLSYGPSLIMRDGLFGEFTTIKTNLRVK